MKKLVVAALAALALVIVIGACKKDSGALVTPATPQGQAAPAPAAPHPSAAADIPAGAGHKGKVLEALVAGEYVYIQIDEGGKKVWVATMQAKVAKGDEIEFADSEPFTNYQSKILNRSFDSVIFAAGIRNNGKK
jgi:glucose/arabinose dehydrogenase